MAFGSCNPSVILLCDNLCPAFLVVCNLSFSVSNLSCRLGFLLSLDNLLDLNLHLMFFVLLQRSGIVELFAASPVVSGSHPFNTSNALCCCSSRNRFFNSAAQLQSPLQSQLGVLLLSRQPSILALLQCVDDFQYPSLSSSVQLLSSRHCSPRAFQPAAGTALSVLLILPCCWVCSSSLLLAVLFCVLLFCGHCHFVQLSELLIDLLLVVVQVLRFCALFRQSGFASFVNFFSSLALLAVILSLFSVFWYRLLQHYFVAVYDSVVHFWPPPTPLLGTAPLRDCWFAVGALAPREVGLQQCGLLSLGIGFSFARYFSFTCTAEMSVSLFTGCVHPHQVRVLIAASDSGQP